VGQDQDLAGLALEPGDVEKRGVDAGDHFLAAGQSDTVEVTRPVNAPQALEAAIEPL
jgi:hypothetical protein